MRKQGFCFLFFIVCQLKAMTQVTDFETFKKNREKEMTTFEHNVKAEMDSLRSSRDRAFSKMLSGNWEREDLLLKTRPSVPKPSTPPVFKEEPKGDKSDEKVEVLLDGNAIDDRVEEVVKEPKEPSSNEEEISMGFAKSFGFTGEFFFGNEWKRINIKSQWPRLNGEPAPSSITEYWNKSSELNYTDVSDYFKAYQKLFQLSDWGVYSMVKEVAKKNFDQVNDQNLFIWFQLVQLGFDARIMYGGQEIVVTLPFDEMIYESTFFEQNGKRYFVLDRKIKAQLYTYQNQHETAQRKLNLNNLTKTIYPEQWSNRVFEFNFNGVKRHVELPFVKYRVDFSGTIPQTELGYYFQEPLPAQLSAQIHGVLDPLMKDLPNDREKVRFLYAMICQGIPYQTDQQQFKKEKFCLPEEVLFYPYADCEDRTFLLNALIREMTHLKTVGLNYPGHVAMAVLLKDIAPQDDLIIVDGVKYVFCDPTYIGADLGMMPGVYKTQSPKLLN